MTPQQERYLRDARVARLATVDDRGNPYVVPVCFVYEAGRIYTALDQKPKSVLPTRLRRVKNILANPGVALLVDHYTEDWNALSYMLVRGKASVVEEEEEERGFAVAALRAKYSQYAEMLKDEATVIAVQPESVSSWAASGEIGEA
jgi:coenzyme F420-0:L-glutamate ligase/coenzyme F420-1:gamma-L-glutamate ligase